MPYGSKAPSNPPIADNGEDNRTTSAPAQHGLSRFVAGLTGRLDDLAVEHQKTQSADLSVAHPLLSDSAPQNAPAHLDVSGADVAGASLSVSGVSGFPSLSVSGDDSPDIYLMGETEIKTSHNLMQEQHFEDFEKHFGKPPNNKDLFFKKLAEELLKVAQGYTPLDTLTASPKQEVARNLTELHELMDFVRRGVAQQADTIHRGAYAKHTENQSKAPDAGSAESTGPSLTVESERELTPDEIEIDSRLNAVEQAAKIVASMQAHAKNKTLVDDQYINQQIEQFDQLLKQACDDTKVIELMRNNLAIALREMTYQNYMEQYQRSHLDTNIRKNIYDALGLKQSGDLSLFETSAMGLLKNKTSLFQAGITSVIPGEKASKNTAKAKNAKVYQAGDQVMVKFGLNSRKDLYGIGHFTDIDRDTLVSALKKSSLLEAKMVGDALNTGGVDFAPAGRQQLILNTANNVAALIADYDKGSKSNPVEISYLWSDGSTEGAPKQPVEAMYMIMEYKRRAILEGKDYWVGREGEDSVKITSSAEFTEDEQKLMQSFAQEHGTAPRKMARFFGPTTMVESKQCAGELVFGKNWENAFTNKGSAVKFLDELTGTAKNSRASADKRVLEKISPQMKQKVEPLTLARNQAEESSSTNPLVDPDPAHSTKAKQRKISKRG